MKPAYADAAKSANQNGLVGKFAAVDCTQESELATKYDVKGFPTCKILSVSNGVIHIPA